MTARKKKVTQKDLTQKEIGLDFDSDGKPDLVFDLKTIILLCTMIGSVTLSYTNLKSEIEVAKKLPVYEDFFKEMSDEPVEEAKDEEVDESKEEVEEAKDEDQDDKE